jgi:SWI/SNF-related matrix-associated actin-dependent regulator of chromatin subfamily A-like protein 1
MLALKLYHHFEWGTRIFLLTRTGPHYGGGGFSSHREHLRKLKDVPGVSVGQCRLHEHMRDEPVMHFPLTSHDEVVKRLEQVEIVPTYILKIFQRPPVSSEFHVSRVSSVWSQLYPFQQEGVRQAVGWGGRALIADEMGLGKTLQGVALLEYYSRDTPLLVICPPAVRESWRYHIEHFTPLQANIILHYTDSFHPEHVNILSYGMLTSEYFQRRMDRFSPQCMVVDESHYIKNMKAQRTRRVFQWSKAKRVILLTGTPLNRPVELYSQLKCVDRYLFTRFFHHRDYYVDSSVVSSNSPTFLKTQFYYASRYCRPEVKYVAGTRTYVFRGSANEGELNALLQRVMIRRRKEDVLPQLPPKTREKIVMDQYVQRQSLEFKNDKEFMALVRDTAQRKQSFVIDYIRDIIIPESEHRQILLWAHHHFMLDALTRLLESHGISWVSLDGRTTATKRLRSIERFQAGEVRVAVLGITALGTGVTLTKATLSIFCELAFNPDTHLQAEDRAHRIGQTEHVVIRYLVCQGSTDEVIWRLLDKKVKQSTLAADGRIRNLEHKRHLLSEQCEDNLPSKRRKVDVEFDK